MGNLLLSERYSRSLTLKAPNLKPMKVSPKKALGQHFLTDPSICYDIAHALSKLDEVKTIVEVGPGTGALTKELIPLNKDLQLFEVDLESVAYLNEFFPEGAFTVHTKDFLKVKLDEYIDGKFVLIGNYPYNISSQILFKAFDYKNLIPEVVGMFQKEVAERVASGPGTKKYGILSVLLQAFYDIEYLFTVGPEKFDPPPKVDSGVIRMVRNNVLELPCSLPFFIRTVKLAFNQRRKTLRNSLKSLEGDVPETFAQRRPEQMSVGDFIELAAHFEELAIDKTKDDE